METTVTTEQLRLGNWIRTQRHRAKLTQKRLAAKLDISYQMLQKFERGEARITVQRLNQLATILGIRPSEVMSDFAALIGGGDAALPVGNKRLSEDEKRLLLALNRIHDKTIRRTLIEHVEALGRK